MAVVDALAPCLPDADGSPAPGLDEIRTDLHAAVAEAEQNGVVFDPMRPVVGDPTEGEASSGRIALADELTRSVAELFNSAWDTALTTLVGVGLGRRVGPRRADHAPVAGFGRSPAR